MRLVGANDGHVSAAAAAALYIYIQSWSASAITDVRESIVLSVRSNSAGRDGRCSCGCGDRGDSMLPIRECFHNLSDKRAALARDASDNMAVKRSRARVM